jgi:hypothetical protein
MRSRILVLVAVLGGCDAGKLTCKDAVLKARAAAELGDDEVAMMVGTCELRDWSGTIRSCVAAAKGAGALDACTMNEPGLADRAAKAMAMMNQFTDQMCACRDTACAQRVSDEMTKWSQEEAQHDRKPPKFTTEQTKHFTEVGERMGKCMQQAMSAGVEPQVPPQVEDR